MTDTATKEPVVLDAGGKSLGRLASEAAALLRGKNSPDFEYHVPPTQKVVITNASQVRVTGSKMTQEGRERYSGYPGGLRKVPYEESFKKDPARFVTEAISGMIPRNKLKKDILKNLTVYAEGETK